MTSNAVDNALDGDNSQGISGGSQGISTGNSSRLKGNLDSSSQTRVNILVGASGTEDDGSDNSSNKNVNYQKDRKHFHHHKRSRLPPKKLEVKRTPSVQDLEKTSANCEDAGGGKKIKIKNHQHHRVVWYFFTCKMVSPRFFLFIFFWKKSYFYA